MQEEARTYINLLLSFNCIALLSCVWLSKGANCLYKISQDIASNVLNGFGGADNGFALAVSDMYAIKLEEA